MYFSVSSTYPLGKSLKFCFRIYVYIYEYFIYNIYVCLKSKWKILSSCHRQQQLPRLDVEVVVGGGEERSGGRNETFALIQPLNLTKEETLTPRG